MAWLDTAMQLQTAGFAKQVCASALNKCFLLNQMLKKTWKNRA